MKIDQPEIEESAYAETLKELEQLQVIVSDDGVKHCIGCESLCSCSRSPTCSCDCSIDCPNIAVSLSSEPDRYPIEEKIAKLAYAVNSLMHCQTCWSCEGHNDSSGELEKWPSVWFYCSSSQIPKLLASQLSSLFFNKKISTGWSVFIAPYSESIDTTYIISPTIELNSSVQLSALRHDVDIIALSLHDGIKADAGRELSKIKRLKKLKLTEKVKYTGGKI